MVGQPLFMCTMDSIDCVWGGHKVQIVAVISVVLLCITQGWSLLCFVLQVWINTSDIILVGLRDYQVCWELTRDTDQTTDIVLLRHRTSTRWSLLCHRTNTWWLLLHHHCSDVVQNFVRPLLKSSCLSPEHVEINMSAYSFFSWNNLFVFRITKLT